jgi:hypothetical protein
MKLSSSCNDTIEFPNNYDMVDTENDYLHVEPFDSILRFVNIHLTPSYKIYDSQAKRKQKYHFLIIKLFLALGTIAIIAAALQLVNKSLYIPPQYNLPGLFIELIVTFIAFLAVMSGIISYFHREWLLDRHKAELIRLLKFHYLLDQRLWENEEFHLANIEKDLESALKTIERVDYQDINRWMLSIPVPEPPRYIGCNFEVEKVQRFFEYYHMKRVKYQKFYYCRKVNQLNRLNKKTENFPNIFLLACTIAVFIHFLIDLYASKSVILSTLSVILIGFVVILPFVGTAIRSYRLSNEISRGINLFKAKYIALNSLDVRLSDLCNNIDSNFEEIMKIIWECENFLELEHREWLVLMKPGSLETL